MDGAILSEQERQLERVIERVNLHQDRLDTLERHYDDTIQRLDRLFGAVLGFGGLITAALMAMVATLWIAH